MHRKVDVPRATKAAAQSKDHSFIIEPVDWNKRSEGPLSALDVGRLERPLAVVRPGFSE